MLNEGGDDCAICLEPLGAGTHRLACKHAFHAWCILRSWRDKPKGFECPMCRGVAYTRPILTIGDTSKRLEAHRLYTRTQIDAWNTIGWIAAFASGFWLATAMFGRLNDLGVVMQYVFVVVTAVWVACVHPRRQGYPSLTLGGEE